MSGEETALKRVSILVTGRVQGVGFRYFTQDIAEQYGITGWVRNAYDRTVEIEAQGTKESLDLFCTQIKDGPTLANVKDVRINEIGVKSEEKDFVIKHG